MIDFGTVYLSSLGLSVAITAGVLWFVWRRRDVRSATIVVMLLGCSLAWDIAYLFQILSRSPSSAWLWHRCYVAAAAFVPVLWAAFTFVYTGLQRWLRTSTWVALATLPALSIFFVFTNDSHHIFFSEVRYTEVEGLYFPEWHPGPWFWVQLSYSYLLVAFGLSLIPRLGIGAFRLYRAQAIALVLGAIAPVAASLVRTLGLSPYPFTFIGFTVSGVCVAWAMFRYQMFELGPIARETVVDRLSDGMLALNLRNQIVDVNPAMLRNLSLEPSKVIGRDAADILPREYDWTGKLNIPPVAGITVRDQIAAERNGTTFHYLIETTPLTDPQGNVTGRLVVLRDVTETIESEEEIRRYAEELKGRNAELDAFAHTVAHDLKNPLSGLMGYSSIFTEEAPKLTPEEISEMAGRMSLLAAKMNRIIDELLLLASLRRRGDLHPRPIDSGAVVAEALSRFEEQIRESGATVLRPASWPRAIGYQPWVEEVWANYISNALKYGGKPPVIELGADELQGDFIRFWCRDKGAGIRADKMDRLFSEFERLAPSKVDGYGLGLSIVRRIVERLGGTVGVESREGAGSLFWFSLPRDRGAKT